MTIITIDKLPEIRNMFKDKKIVFCCGSFDITHAGHILFFEDCKKLGDILVVAVGGDKILKSYKGDKRPVLNENVRLKTVDSFKPVDYSFINNVSTRERLNYILDVTFEKLKPDVYAVNDDTWGMEYRKKTAENFNVKMVILKRRCPKEFEDISTTKIIEKIKSL